MRSAREAVIDVLERSLAWWRQLSPSPLSPDVDGSLCRLRARRHDNRGRDFSTLTNMVLVRAVGGRLSAAILIDPADGRGPRKHWPARALAVLFQLSVLQSEIEQGRLPQLPDLVAVLNPHDHPEQVARTTSWVGLLPLLSSSRVLGKHRDLMMPDYSFAQSAYLTNTLTLASRTRGNTTLPRGWPEEYRAILAAGERTPWTQKRPTLFWRGGLTNAARLNYATNLTNGHVTLPSGVRVDVRLPCRGHCTAGEGAVPPEEWCRNQFLLSLPGTSFAVGFKYVLLCGAAVIRGHHGLQPEHEQW